MTQQEQEMLQGLIQRVNQTRLEEKDSDAEEMLNQTLGRNPDALYILAQTVLVQQYALDQAKQQLDQFRQQPRRATSFLGGLLGRDQPSAPPPPPPGYAPAQYASSAPPAYGYGAQSGFLQQGSFLRGAAQTAAGVAAGALAFQGIESLLHGFGHSSGYGFGDGDRPEIINNYYGDDGGREHASALSPDIEDRRGDSLFSQSVDNDDHGNGLMDDSNFDADSSGFDDGSDLSDDFGGDDSSF